MSNVHIHLTSQTSVRPTLWCGFKVKTLHLYSDETKRTANAGPKLRKTNSKRKSRTDCTSLEPEAPHLIPGALRAIGHIMCQHTLPPRDVCRPEWLDEHVCSVHACMLAHVFPPLTYEQILALEGPEKCAQARVQKGHWRDFNGGPPPSRAPLVFGPVCPTLVERGDSLSDTDEHSSLLSLRLYKPSESVLQWITAHVSGKSTEGVRTTTTRFWLRRPGLFHRNSA
eukprot:s23_g6.t1